MYRIRLLMVKGWILLENILPSYTVIAIFFCIKYSWRHSQKESWLSTMTATQWLNNQGRHFLSAFLVSHSGWSISCTLEKAPRTGQAEGDCLCASGFPNTGSSKRVTDRHHDWGCWALRNLDQNIYIMISLELISISSYRNVTVKLHLPFYIRIHTQRHSYGFPLCSLRQYRTAISSECRVWSAPSP